MREQLIQYVELLFAAASDSDEIKQEILQNTLDRYDDLVSQGKSPEAAYRLAISGIGDINEILGGQISRSEPVYQQDVRQAVHEEADPVHKRILRSVAVALYILCPVPLIVLSEMGMDTIGISGLLGMVAIATGLMVMGRKKGPQKEDADEVYTSPEKELRKSISNAVWAIGLAVYFIISFATMAWYVTWVLFPIIGSVQGLINACLDLKEASKYEN